MDKWFYNSDNGAVDKNVDWFSVHSGIGWHGPFNSKQDALNYYEENKGSNPGWKAPTGFIGTLINGAESIGPEASRATNDAKKVVNSVTDPLGKFNLGGWFLRIGEIVLGLILVGVGVAKLTGTQNVVSKAVKVAALA